MGLMDKMFVEDLQVSGKNVIVRVDFNVPLKDGKVENDKRIKAALPTIQYLMKKGARVILMSHLGRPRGKVDPAQSLRPAVPILEAALSCKVAFAEDCVGEVASKAASALKDGELLLLENLRFHEEEEKNNSDFAKSLASLAELYVNDAFGTAHRAHASTEGITHHIKECASGYLMKKELDYLGKVITKPEHPFVAILGGAKVSDKIMVIENMLPKVDKILIGGGMTFTFLKAKGLNIGKSLLEADRVDFAKELLTRGGDKIVLPVDFQVSSEFDFAARKAGPLSVVNDQSISDNAIGLDIGPESVKLFSAIIEGAKTVMWNGPMGVFEVDSTAVGTIEVAKALAAATAKGATTVVGGGDSASAVKKAGLSDKVSHVSTGGGASLEFLEGRELPGVTALTDRK